MTSLTLAAMVLLTACETTVSDVRVAAPPVIKYSPKFQTRLKGELKAAPPSCDRVDPQPGCSAMARATQDYKWTRDRIRSLQSKKAGKPAGASDE
jgi:hypothetical protein